MKHLIIQNDYILSLVLISKNSNNPELEKKEKKLLTITINNRNDCIKLKTSPRKLAEKINHGGKYSGTQ